MEVLGDDVSMLDAYAAANDVLHGAVVGHRRGDQQPGPGQRRLRRRAHGDGRGRHGDDGLGDGGRRRSRAAGGRAGGRSPLLEDVNLAGARGVLVNITASAGLKMKEYHEVMNTIKEFTADDAMVIVGTVIDDAMDDRLRVTMIATGLGGAAAQRAARRRSIELVEPTQVVERTGTDDVGVSRRDDRLRESRRSRR